ncbi:MAG: hypothetical protein ACKO37_08690 [Vampirovibrionales bacterium]
MRPVLKLPAILNRTVSAFTKFGRPNAKYPPSSVVAAKAQTKKSGAINSFNSFLGGVTDETLTLRSRVRLATRADYTEAKAKGLPITLAKETQDEGEYHWVPGPEIQTTRNFLNGKRKPYTRADVRLARNAAIANEMTGKAKTNIHLPGNVQNTTATGVHLRGVQTETDPRRYSIVWGEGATPIDFKTSMTPQRKIALRAGAVLATAGMIAWTKPLVEDTLNRPSTLQTTFSGYTTEKQQKEKALEATRKDPTPGTTELAQKALSKHLDTQKKQLQTLEIPILGKLQSQNNLRQKASLYATVKQGAERSGLGTWQQDAQTLYEAASNASNYDSLVKTLPINLQQKLRQNPMLANSVKDIVEKSKPKTLKLAPASEALRTQPDGTQTAVRLRYSTKDQRHQWGASGTLTRNPLQDMTMYYNPHLGASGKYRVVDDTYARQLYALGLTPEEVLQKATVLLEDAKPTQRPKS